MKSKSKGAARRRFLQSASSAVLLATAPGIRAQTESWPAKPIRFIVPYPAGGGADAVGRLVAQKLGAALGQQVIVENKPGASTIIGTETVGRASPDGYTMGLISDSHAVNPSFFPKLPYDSMRDFEFAAKVVEFPLILVAKRDLNVRTVKELIALAKERDGKLNFASAGNATPQHLAMEWFKLLTGTNMNHVPYKGANPALMDVLGGQVDLMFGATASVVPHLGTGKLTALAVTNVRRLPNLPDLPTMAESLPEFDSFSSWFGIVMPAGTPKSISARVSKEVQAMLELADVKRKVDDLGLIATPSSNPEEFRAFVARELDIRGKLVKLAGVKHES
ncbi:tripartite tricarboxylate transporter substrate binding protein [uncultured Pigmentiphaga sp.]|uniref:Bug family tripartite tricarboxylate transporter substrate binding protein n=1 Tax=uncultured Pigmentiphaga sp. TaxID=340361 RepID=UPI00261B7F9A|nr:tripartite tricarboxylate transporter substrate binding protein [uncultured Pigmentiphaga sp.]